MRMPLRFVWGVRAKDKGSHLDPGDKGELELDPDFDASTSDAQRWMLDFCQVRSIEMNLLVDFNMLSQETSHWEATSHS